MATRQFLGEFEELIMLAIMKLGPNAYGVSISEAIEDATGKRVSTGALYTALQRLEEKGFISSKIGESTPERGGKAKKYFDVRNAGREAVKSSSTVRAALTRDLDWELVL